jgi:hypothetical protein
MLPSDGGGGAVVESEERLMGDEVSPKPPGNARGRPFAKGRSGNPTGRRTRSHNKATLTAAALLAGESEALTRKAVELALLGDPTAMRLCLERIMPPSRERTVKFALPPIESAADTAAAMKAVTSALAGGTITPGGHGRGARRHLCPRDRSRSVLLLSSSGAIRKSDNVRR